jgi:hypothetical protein
MVGARNVSAAAVKLAREFASALASGGFTIVSGLARGIDGAAHLGALPATVGVIASDPQRFMPLMQVCIWEKLCFGIPALAFFARGQADAVRAAFGAVDLFLGALFFLAWRRMRAAT